MDAISSNSACLVHTVDLPASGKSTWALKSGFDAAVSLDDCRQELWGDFSIQNGPGGICALLVLQGKKIRRAMEQGQSIVVHNTHHLREFGRSLTGDMARQLRYYVQIVYFDVAPDEVVGVTVNVVIRFLKRLWRNLSAPLRSLPRMRLTGASFFKKY